MNKRRLFRDMRPDFQVEVSEVIYHILEICAWCIVFTVVSQCFAVSPTIVSFTGGQVTPHLESRPDFQKYATASRTMENFLPAIQGPAVRRSGTRYVAQAAAAVEGGVTSRPDPDPTKIGISTMTELALIGYDEDYPLSGDYELQNDLDADGITFWPIGMSSITKGVAVFTGTFDGNYYKISNMTIDETVLDAGVNTDEGGLFWRLDSATIENLTISNMTISGSATTNFSGGLLANNSTGTSVVTNVHVQGTMIGEVLSAAGGMFQSANPDMSICSADVFISSGRSSIKAGGLVQLFGGNAINCYAQGTIESTATAAGGLNDIGGLFAEKTGTNQTVENCYSAVIIQGPIRAAGDVGGFEGEGGGGTPVFTSNYWDDDIIPVHDLDDIGDVGDVAGILKSTTTDMQQQATFVNWDFDDIWVIDEGNDYPRFQWQVRAENLETPYLSGNDNIRLIPFTVSTDDSYVLEFGNQYIRFYRDSELD